MTNIWDLIGSPTIRRLEKEIERLEEYNEALSQRVGDERRAQEAWEQSYNVMVDIYENRLQLAEERVTVFQEDLEKAVELLKTPPHARSQEPLWLSEPDEDAVALATAEAEDLLRQLEFENSDIEIDDPSEDSLF